MARFVVTGCTRGLGRAIATTLLNRHHEVVGLARRPQLSPRGVQGIRCDLEDRSSILRAAHAVHGPIDGIIHNAGLFVDTVQHTIDGYERMWAVHVLGPLLLTEWLMPILNPGGHIVFVGSAAYSRGIMDDAMVAGQRGYRRSKLGQAAVSCALAERLATQGIRVNSVHPGLVNTDLRSRSTSGWQRTVGTMRRVLGRSPQRGASTVVDVALSPRWAGVSGGFFSPRGRMPLAHNLLALDRNALITDARRQLALPVDADDASHTGVGS